MSLLQLLFITVVAGGLGGLAASLMLGDADDLGIWDKTATARRISPPKVVRNVFLGAVAALLVPLFLSLAKSEIVKNVTSTTDKAGNENILIYVGFCLVAAISFKRFLTSVPDQVLSSLKSEVNVLKQKNENVQTDLEEVKENVDATSAPLNADAQEAVHDEAATRAQADQLPKAEAEALKAMRDSRLMKRTVAGVAKHARMSHADADVALQSLAEKGLLEEVVSDTTGRTLYVLNDGGRAVARLLP
ncbi:YEATS-associated helix-containing protein [Jiella sonneratiae]|uniref:YEATS-Like-Associating Three TM domain-containing protein n=1 Tax=Jiella sonneratiae TaxID=2816856 RepID=A0ABS3J3U0_9HYPH|nr:YEATS-associated helix-containing protein [Jiella sonneratiae]MBO0904335.1 hypothetical protein [Jiella sonneratiae]